MEIAMIYLRGLLQRRLNLPRDNNEALIQQLISNVHQSVGDSISIESLKEKTKVLALT
jgi:hypothetical protein